MAKPTVSDQLIAHLKGLGVERVYGLVGDSLNPVIDSLRRIDGIDFFPVHNEESAAFAAAAESRLTGKLTVCAGSCGPGNTHLVQGLYDANRSGAKVLAIASHIPSAQIGTQFFQATHPETLLAEASTYIELLNSPEQAARVLHIATQTAIAKNGVATIVLPGDLAEQDAVDAPALGYTSTRPPRHVPHPDAITDLAKLIEDAERPFIFAGAGVAGSRELVFALAEKLQAPIGHALGGLEHMAYDNPYDVGMNGLLGYGACFDAMHKADLVLMLGTDFPYDAFLPQGPTMVQVDRYGEQLGRRTKLDLAIEGDVDATIEAVLPLLKKDRDDKYLSEMCDLHKKAVKKVVDAYATNVENMTPIHPEMVASELNEVASQDAVFTVDTGMCNVWAARYIKPCGTRRVLGSWHHGTMANALPHAIGAAAADPSRQVISMCGDGGLSMLMGELLTVADHELPVKMIVFNNSSLGMVKLEMLVEGMPDYGTDRHSTNFAAIAQACGIPSVRVEDPKKVREELMRALAAPGPFLLDVVTDPDALSIPPEITMEQVKGFATAAAREVMRGNLGKMMGLARSNFRNIPH